MCVSHMSLCSSLSLAWIQVKLTRIHTKKQGNTHVHTHSIAPSSSQPQLLSLILFCSLTLHQNRRSLSHFLALPYTHILSHEHTLSRTLCPRRSLSLSCACILSRAHTHPLACTHTLSLSLSPFPNQILTGSHVRVCKDILGGVPSLASASPRYMSLRNDTLYAIYFPVTDPFAELTINYSAPGAPNMTLLLENVGRTPVCNLNLCVCWRDRACMTLHVFARLEGAAVHLCDVVPGPGASLLKGVGTVTLLCASSSCPPPPTVCACGVVQVWAQPDVQYHPHVSFHGGLVWAVDRGVCW
jgi:hypothetical protein